MLWSLAAILCVLAGATPASAAPTNTQIPLEVLLPGFTPPPVAEAHTYGLLAQASGRQVSLSWNTPTLAAGQAVRGYHVYRFSSRADALLAFGNDGSSGSAALREKARLTDFPVGKPVLLDAVGDGKYYYVVQATLTDGTLLPSTSPLEVVMTSGKLQTGKPAFDDPLSGSQAQVPDQQGTPVTHVGQPVDNLVQIQAYPPGVFFRWWGGNSVAVNCPEGYVVPPGYYLVITDMDLVYGGAMSQNNARFVGIASQRCLLFTEQFELEKAEAYGDLTVARKTMHITWTVGSVLSASDKLTVVRVGSQPLDSYIVTLRGYLVPTK